MGRGSPASFPGEVIRASVWNDDDRYVGVVTAPSRGDAPALSDVELLPPERARRLEPGFQTT